MAKPAAPESGPKRPTPGGRGPWRSLQWQLLGRIVWAVLAALVLIGAGVYAFTSHNEGLHWRMRQQDATRHAVEVLSGFAQRSGDALHLVGLLDPEDLRRRPEIQGPFLAENPALLELVRLARDGSTVAQTHRDRRLLANLFTLRQSHWYQRAMAGSPFMGGVEVSAQNEPYLILARPAPDGGVVAARLSAGVLWSVTRELRFGDTGITCLLDRSGRVVAHPEPRMVLAWTTLAGRPELASILAAPDQSWAGAYRNLDGGKVQGVSLAVPGTDWIALSEISREETARASRTALFLLDGGILVFGLVGFFLIARQVRRVVSVPLEFLRAGAERIGSGDLTHRIALERTDEVGEVAAAFNEMARRLSEREAELAANARALAAEVGERRRSEEALRLAKEAAEAGNRSKSEFLARMSHEVRTPMNGVLGMAELLLTTHLDARQRRYVETVRTSGNALLCVLNDVLDLAKVEAGRLDLARVPFEPGEVLDRVVGLHAAAARGKGLHLAAEVAPGLPRRVAGDPHRLFQILGNLLSNAVKFTERGGVIASASLAGRDGDEVVLEFSVRDTGIGIDPAHHARIFEEFTQVEGYLTRSQGGTGLGLAIARRLAELMGGTIRVESAAGSGATFVALLPFRASEGTAPAPEGHAPLEAPAEASGGVPARVGERGLRVLIAEDNDVNRELLAEVLGLFGCVWEAARDGREALAAAVSGRYDLILMDCQMPHMDGYEATRLIRAAEAEAGAARVPIVAVTGHALAGERERCLEAGMDDFLAKPFSTRQIRALLERWCGDGGAVGADPPGTA